ncbi:hypothetical protein [Acetobacter sp. UBA5411]|uniref:hypothetical protein n=1 Tax=Acetobacter sp. UBA5411 TaxID=1945905 RepID=UPI0025C2B5BB|nr:hypothetical protein [Acetobacter sp. UBA5411]
MTEDKLEEYFLEHPDLWNNINTSFNNTGTFVVPGFTACQKNALHQYLEKKLSCKLSVAHPAPEYDYTFTRKIG